MIAALVPVAAAVARCAVLERRLGRARTRLESVADAEHELRGALTAFGLGLERLRRDPSVRRIAWSLGSELERARRALDDLAGARAREAEPLALQRLARASAAAWSPAAGRAGRRLELDWRAGPVRVRADRGRLAQALGNLLSNAVEHGAGPVRLEARRTGDRVRLEVVNAVPEAPRPEASPRETTGLSRGRGLRIAARAVESCGGTLSLSREGGRVAAAVELPLER